MCEAITAYEMIDRLCAVTEGLAGLVRKQAEVLAQADVPEDVLAALAAERDAADGEMDLLEYRLRRLRAEGR